MPVADSCTAANGVPRWCSAPRFPTMGQLLRFGCLCWGQFGSDSIPVSCRVFIPPFRRQVEPRVRTDIVLREAVAIEIHGPETILSVGDALVGRLAIPTHRSRTVLRNTLALGVHEPETVLSAGDALLGRLAKPIRRSRIIARN